MATRTREPGKEDSSMPQFNAHADIHATRGVSLIVPTVIEAGARGERAYDLFSRLLRERIVLVNGMIEDQMANLIVAELLFLASESAEHPVNVYISSPGG